MLLRSAYRLICRHPRKCFVIVLVEIIVALLVFNNQIPFLSLKSPISSNNNDPYGLSQRNSSYFAQKMLLPKKQPLDLHLEDGRVIDSFHRMIGSGRREGKRIAIGLAVTSKGIGNITSEQVRYRFPFFRSLMPSMCKTSAQGYHYHVYIAYDSDDAFFTDKEKLLSFVRTFYDVKEEICSFVTGLWLHLIKCSHAHKPAWAQNDAMYEAYLDNMDYYYRVNDDTYLKTPGWTERFTATLENLHPPNIGVVGPKHDGGKLNILTHDFVHRSHIDVFGFHYPRSFTDWWADDWITGVYQPGRSVKILDTKVLHTQEFGTRYDNQFGRVQFLGAEIDQGKKILNRYLSAMYDKADLFQNRTSNGTDLHSVKVTQKKLIVKSNEVKVIAMSLWGNSTNQTFGAIRNVNLAKIFFSTWTVRIHVEDSNISTVYDPVPQRILQKLQYLGAELRYIPSDLAKAISPSFWHYLVADDGEVSRFIIRNPESRLSERDADVVEEWEKSGQNFHCVRDHPKHAALEIVDGLWGGKPAELQKALNKSIKQELIDYLNKVAKGLYHRGQNLNQAFLSKVLWAKIKGTILCHDSISCDTGRDAVGFPFRRDGHEYVGELFDTWGVGDDLGEKQVHLGASSKCDGNKNKGES